MRNITYKYNVGDLVVIKPKHHREVELPQLGKVKVGLGKIAECRDYNGPCYRLEGFEGFWQEHCFAGLAFEALKNSPCYDEIKGPDMIMPTPLSCDTESFKEV